MICEHLRAVDLELTKQGLEVIYKDTKPWSKQCRRWTRYACVLDLESLRRRLSIPDCVTDHLHDDIWTGNERGFYCEICHDAVIGDYDNRNGHPIIA